MAQLFPLAWSTTIRRAEELLFFCQKVAEFLRTVSNIPLLDGQLVTVAFTASAQGIARHTLGRPYRGAIIVTTSNAIAAAYALAPALVSDPANYVPIQANGAQTATVVAWVF